MTTPIDLPPLPAHPDPHAFNWSKAELRAIKSYATAAVVADRAAAQPVQPAASAAGPKELWLQLHGDCSDDELLEPVDYTSNEVTWCWHAINNSDVRYVRADLAQPTHAEYQQVAYMWKEDGFAGSPRVCYHEFSPGYIDNAEPLYRKLSTKEAT